MAQVTINPDGSAYLRKPRGQEFTLVELNEIANAAGASRAEAADFNAVDDETHRTLTAVKK
jgi:hypothetical protein